MRIRRVRRIAPRKPTSTSPAAPRTGILCPVCGTGTRVMKTTNYDTWLKRVRVCRSSSCSHVFPTKEVPMPSAQRELF